MDLSPNNIQQFTTILFYMYLIQGLPYGIQAKFLPIFLRKNGYTLTQVSFIKFLYIPLLFKTLYAPFIQLYMTKKTWMQISLCLLTINSFILIFLKDLNIYHLSIGIFTMNLLCSIQDVALDSLALSILHNPNDIVNNNVAQVVGYKIGSLLGGGILLTLSSSVKWQYLFMIITFMYGIGFLLTMFCSSIKKLPRDVISDRDGSYIRTSATGVDIASNHALHIRQSFNNPDKLSVFKIIIQSVSSSATFFTIVYLVLYKLGEQGATNMLPLYLLDLKTRVSMVGFWTGIMGQVISIIGSAYSGLFVRNFSSTIKAIQYLSLIVAPLLTGLAFVVGPNHVNKQYIIVSSIVLLNFLYLISGMLTTATFTVIMQCSHTRPQHLQNTNYTVLATLEVFGKLIFTSSIGIFTDYYGYFYSYILFAILAWSSCLYIALFQTKFNFTRFRVPSNSIISRHTELIEF